MLAGPLGQPRTPGVMFGGYRTVSFDGCKSLRVPDTAREPGLAGQAERVATGETGYPALSLMTLVETGTRALLGAVFGSQADGEAAWARKLLHLLDATMLLLMDRGFDAGDFLAAVAATRRPVPGPAERHPPPAGAAAPARRVVTCRSSAA